MGPKTREDILLLRSAAAELAEREVEKERSKVRFGAKPSGLFDDRLSTKAAPAPKGPPMSQMQEEARQRRRAREHEERTRRG